MPSSGHEPLEIALESGDNGLVLRGLTGEESDPAVLNGELVLDLAEATNLKEIQLVFTGIAKVTWRDSSSHHYEHPLFFHDFSFLNPYSGSTPHVKTPSQTHTLQAGRHLFPFSLHIPGSLPASLRTYSGTCVTEYRLKAIATRPGFGSDWKTKKTVRITRAFGQDAVEYNQTLEIQNTWPGKVSYAFTLPHKAYAAGETIPVSVKFSPLAKGVKIVSLVTTIREHTTVHSKSSSHSEARDSTVVKYNFVPDSAEAVPSPPLRIESSASLASLNHNFSAPGTPSGAFSTLPIANHEPHRPIASGSGSGVSSSPRRVRTSGGLENLSADNHEEEEEEISTEIDVVVEVPIPVWTTPTHSVHPVFVNHKIKWSAFIKNPDGHVSELRCALPIHILATSLVEEARLASAGSRNLLFGESGVLAHSDVPQVDLPSYQDHIMDRIANAETASYFSLAAGFTPTPWSARSTPQGTPGHSPPPSRPPSPTRRHSSAHLHTSGLNGLSRMPYNPQSSTITSGRSSGSATPVHSPEIEQHPEDHRNWIDSELLGTLNLDHTTTPPGSNPSSRPNSRPPSRPGSPVRDLPASLSLTPHHEAPPPLTRTSTSGSGFFHLHLPKPLRPLTAFSRNNSSNSVPQSSHHQGSHSALHSPLITPFGHPSPSALSQALAVHAAKFGTSQSYDTHTHTGMSNSPTGVGTPASTSPVTQTSFFPISSSYQAQSGPVSPAQVSSPSNLNHSPSHGLHTPANPEVDFLSAVPSYDVAARGFLGGGVIPISTGLPNYEDFSEETK